MRDTGAPENSGAPAFRYSSASYADDAVCVSLPLQELSEVCPLFEPVPHPWIVVKAGAKTTISGFSYFMCITSFLFALSRFSQLVPKLGITKLFERSGASPICGRSLL
jgi:hypothetical protein